MPPAPYPSSRPRTAAPSRTARPVMNLVRPVRIDLTGGTPFGGWQTAADNGVTSDSLPMADMADRASAQLAILRKAVDEAAHADHAVRTHVGELTQRLAQGQRFAAELDERMIRAGKAAGIVEKAASALGALQMAVQQVRTAQDAVTKPFEAKLVEQERILAERLAQQEAAFEQRMARQQEVFERRIGELSATFEETISRAVRDSDMVREHSERAIGEHRRAIVSETEQVCAAADRHIAQVQSRGSLILDGVADRMDVLTQQCDRIGKDAQANLDAMCERAARILGHDPRSDFASEPRLGSLADAATRADALVLGVNEAVVRIATLRSDAEQVLRRLVDVRDEAERVIEDRLPRLDTLRTTLDEANAQATMMQQTLDDALHQQADAADKSASASMLLGRQREDLAAVAEAGRYHVEQCRAAADALREMIEQAGAQGAELDRAAAAVRAQAENMVELARDAAALVAKARATAQATDGPEAHA